MNSLEAIGGLVLVTILTGGTYWLHRFIKPRSLTTANDHGRLWLSTVLVCVAILLIGNLAVYHSIDKFIGACVAGVFYLLFGYLSGWVFGLVKCKGLGAKSNDDLQKLKVKKAELEELAEKQALLDEIERLEKLLKKETAPSSQ